MNTLLWIGQTFLAVIFLYSGICKSILTKEALVARGQTGVAGRQPSQIRFIGISEIIGSIGIILPWWTGIFPFLTPLAAAGFAAIMLLAAPIHYRLKEGRNVALNLFVLLIALFVAWSRARTLAFLPEFPGHP